MARKVVSKASKAAKILSNPKASKKKKSAAGKTLAKSSKRVRVVKSALKTGKVSRKAARAAVRAVVKKKG